MIARPLGTSGLATPPLVLGGNTFGWTADRATSFAVLDAFVDGGGTMIDTADIYSAWAPGNHGGESETILGDWLAQGGRRDRVTIATKGGIVMRDGAMAADLTPAHLLAAVDASLARLRTDRIDLYFAHRDDPDGDLSETLAALDGMVRAGKVRALGASNYTAERLDLALRMAAGQGLTAFTVLQPEYNLVERGFEAALQPLCVAHGIGVIPYFGLASGFLTGKYRPGTDSSTGARGHRVSTYANDHGWRVLAALDQVAGQTGASLAAIALAWLASRPAITAPIASATAPSQVAELLAAMTLVLTPAQLALLDDASGAMPAAA